MDMQWEVIDMQKYGDNLDDFEDDIVSRRLCGLGGMAAGWDL